MLNSNYIIYFIKEYFAIIFYLLIIFNIVIRVIVTKKNKKKKKKKKSRKGGGILGDILYVLLCIITFGWSCNFWDRKGMLDLLRLTPENSPKNSPENSSHKKEEDPHFLF